MDCPKCKEPGRILRRTEFDHYSATIYRCTQGVGLVHIGFGVFPEIPRFIS